MIQPRPDSAQHMQAGRIRSGLVMLSPTCHWYFSITTWVFNYPHLGILLSPFGYFIITTWVFHCRKLGF